MSDKTKQNASLGCEELGSRVVPAFLSSGNLIIQGTHGDDDVYVKHVNVNGVGYIQVDFNGHVQKFKTSHVYGQIKFWGYNGHDYFDYVGWKGCYVDAGNGDDYVSCDGGHDTVYGGYGKDKIEGWGGNDWLKGGHDADVIDGGYGNDTMFGEGGDDWMGGGHGNDKLYCGSGQDLAWGGGGADWFYDVKFDNAIYFVPIHTPFGTAGKAGVQDYQGWAGDKIWS